MKVIYNKIIPFGRKFMAINLFGIVFAKGHCDSVTINHESIHTAQMRVLLYVPFYLWYLFEWLWKLLIYRNFYLAYMNIGFEREAYANDGNPDYLNHRTRFAFLKYLSKDNSKRG